MPIPQIRLIALATNGDILLDIIDETRNKTKEMKLPEAIANINGNIMPMLTDSDAREALGEIASLLKNIYHVIVDMEVPLSVRKNIMEEKIHFKVHRKGNEMVAIHMRLKRQAKEEMQRSEEQISHFFSSEADGAISPKAIHQQKLRENEEYRIGWEKRKEEMEGDGYIWNEETMSWQTNEELKRKKLLRQIEEDKAEAYSGPTTLLPPDAEMNIANISSSKQDIKETITEATAPPPLTGKAYKDSRVVATSVPSNEELYKNPLKPGQDLL